MKNFKSSIPESIQLKLKEIADFINDNMSEMISGHKSFGSICESYLHEIEGNYVSGWIPNQDGGFSVDQRMRNDIDSSYHFTEKQTEYMSEQAKSCWNAFLHDSGLSDETEYSDLTDEQQSKLDDYEYDWFEPALLQFQMFAEDIKHWESGEKQIVMRVSINYKDAPYYREKYAEDIKQIVLDADEFLQMPISDIIEQLKV